jgi:hypothetical protein
MKWVGSIPSEALDRLSADHPKPFLPKIVDATVQMRMSGVPFRLLAPPPSVPNTCERMHRLTDGVDVRIARKSMENPLKIGRTPGTGLVDARDAPWRECCALCKSITCSVPVNTMEEGSNRGGRRPGAGRKPNYLKRLGIKAMTAAEILAHFSEIDLWRGLLTHKNANIRLQTLQYLTDRRDGRPHRKDPRRQEFDSSRKG